jgi:hypothetical protein
VLLVQDAARVRVVREDARRVFPIWRASLGLVLLHPAKWLGVWGWNALLLLLAFALYLALASAVPPLRLLLVVVLLQQAFVVARCALRVWLMGAELELVSMLRPPPPSALEALLQDDSASALGPVPEPAA